jgi:hypothetical protein
MENQNVPIEMWTIHTHRHTTNNAGEGWNSKPSGIIRKKQLNALLLVEKLNEATEIKGS